MTSSIPIFQLPSNQPSKSATPVFSPTYPVQARTFNMNIKDVVQSSVVVAGTLSVNNTNAKVLFDSEATRSFISESFIGKLNYEIELLVEPLSIILANQERVSVKDVFLRCKIDCKKKKVILNSPQGRRVEFKGQKQVKTFLTMIQAKRLLRQGFEGYLAHLIDRSKKTPNIGSIPIVSKFSDVFPDELPGLPPDRQIEFSIDIAPDVELVSKAITSTIG
ncbi:uncharacterized protein LOC141666298 [Apium graveolens]|uniref:uncharacterized protein LOC141666298 n=1 Tax=Apium graveolens TaxID=4045 RepID=UPI003D7B7287